jgi:hypothetical protein
VTLIIARRQAALEINFINQPMENQMNERTNSLDAAYARRATARTAAAESAATLTRAQRLAEVAGQKVANLERQLGDLEAAQAERLAAAIADGRPTSAAVDAEGFAAGGELAAAKFHAGVSSRALASIQATHVQRQAELQAAETAVITEVNRLLDSDDIEVARQLSHHLSEASRIGKRLLFATLANEMNDRRASPAEVSEVLRRLELPLIDRMHIAVNLTKTGDTAALALRAERRAALIAAHEFPLAADAAA